MQNDDFGEETSLLSQSLAKEDKGNYNAWYARKKYFIRHGSPVEKELAFVDECMEGKAKSFQIWEHKRFLTEHTKDYEGELPSANMVFDKIDSKNYHVWSYRIWLVTHGGFYDK